MKTVYYNTLVMIILLGVACSDDPVSPPDDDTLPGTPFQTSNIKEEPVLFDFGTGTVATGWDVIFLADASNNGSPDLALNSGSNGAMGVQIINLGVVDFDTASVPDSGFNADSDTSLVVGGTWYNYDQPTNDIISKDEVFIIQGWNYTTIKLTLLDYLNSKFHIKYSLLGSDLTWGTAVIDSFVVESGSQIYYEFLTGDILTAKPDWDIAFATVLVDAGPAGFIPSPGARLNSVSGVEIAVLDSTNSFEDVTSVPSGIEFNSDAGQVLALGDQILFYTGAPDHLVIGNGEIYLIRTVEGSVFKFQIDSYYLDPDLPGENSGYVSFRFEKF